MKGIILAGGAGTRLHPLTRVVSKQLLPVYNKPMIYYPLSHSDAGGDSRHPDHRHAGGSPRFRSLLGDGEPRRSLCYAEQPAPEGLAQAFLIGAEFIGRDAVALVLGDNLFFGHGLSERLQRAPPIPRARRSSGTTSRIPNATASSSSTIAAAP